MAIRFLCYSCGQQIEFDDALAGQPTGCPLCGVRVRVPAEQPPEVAPAAAGTAPKAGVIPKSTLVAGLEPEYQLIYEDGPSRVAAPSAPPAAAAPTSHAEDDDPQYQLIYEEKPDRGLKPAAQPAVAAAQPIQPAAAALPMGKPVQPAAGSTPGSGQPVRVAPVAASPSNKRSPKIRPPEKGPNSTDARAAKVPGVAANKAAGQAAPQRAGQPVADPSATQRPAGKKSPSERRPAENTAIQPATRRSKAPAAKLPAIENAPAEVTPLNVDPAKSAAAESGAAGGMFDFLSSSTAAPVERPTSVPLIVDPAAAGETLPALGFVVAEPPAPIAGGMFDFLNQQQPSAAAPAKANAGRCAGCGVQLVGDAKLCAACGREARPPGRR